ncbi:MAG TPA: sigma 54-interacting transcriptional regulator [Thermoanaerobaculia bacterium]
MLLRAVVAGPPPLRQRVRRALSSADVLLEEVAADGGPAALDHDVCDLVFLASTALAGEPRQGVLGLRQRAPRCEVVVLQAREDAEERAALLGAGCFGVVSEELSDGGLARALGAFVERRREQVESGWRAASAAPAAAAGDGDDPPRSPAMRRLLATAARAAGAGSSLLLLGETGAGKEWLARWIHARSPRARGPFVAVNCASIPETLWESELFGHERGAFTGAERGRRGHFEVAHRGTLFLDEIGEIPLHLQAKLLRALDERVVQRLGGEAPVAIDVRVMAATNRDLDAAVQAGSFRRDLYYRLAVVTLEVPPLRERREDVPMLARTFLDRVGRELPRRVAAFSEPAMAALMAHDWPGNVRELANAIERAVLLAEGNEIRPTDLPARLVGSAAGPGGERRAVDAEGEDSFARHLGPDWVERSLAEVRRELVEGLEEAYLRRLLSRTDGHLAATAERAGIDQRSLYNKMRAYGLRKEDFRREA